MSGVGKGVAAMIAFLRCGQPRVAPSTGYSPLLALMARRLTDDEAQLAAAGLVRRCPTRTSDIDIAAAILAVTDELPTAADIARVRRASPGVV
jgi:hypothetical protein